MSKRNEDAKRRNANEDNLLQLEMDRFEREHNKEMKTILQEKQIAKEAMSDIRRHRTSSLLTARLTSQNSFPTVPTKQPCLEKRMGNISSDGQSFESRKESLLSSVPDTVTKTEHFNMTLSQLSKTDINFGHRKRAQTFSEGTECIHTFVEYSSIPHNPRFRPSSSKSLLKNNWIYPTMKDVRSNVQDYGGESKLVARLRSQTDSLLQLKRRGSFGFESSSLTANQYSRVSFSPRNSPVLLTRRANTVSAGIDNKTLKRNHLELPCVQPPSGRLSPSRDTVKFRQAASPASNTAQTLVSRYQRDKAILKASENLTVEREKREMERLKHQQLKEDIKTSKSSKRRDRFFTVAQLVMALNKLKFNAAAGRRSSPPNQ